MAQRLVAQTLDCRLFTGGIVFERLFLFLKVGRDHLGAGVDAKSVFGVAGTKEAGVVDLVFIEHE